MTTAGHGPTLEVPSLPTPKLSSAPPGPLPLLLDGDAMPTTAQPSLRPSFPLLRTRNVTVCLVGVTLRVSVCPWEAWKWRNAQAARSGREAAGCVVSAHRHGLYKEREAPARVAQERLVAEGRPVAIDGRVAISGGAAAYSAAVLQRHALLLQLRVELVFGLGRAPTQHVRQHRREKRREEPQRTAARLCLVFPLP